MALRVIYTMYYIQLVEIYQAVFMKVLPKS